MPSIFFNKAMMRWTYHSSSLPTRQKHEDQKILLEKPQHQRCLDGASGVICSSAQLPCWWLWYIVKWTYEIIVSPIQHNMNVRRAVHLPRLFSLADEWEARRPHDDASSENATGRLVKTTTAAVITLNFIGRGDVDIVVVWFGFILLILFYLYPNI